MSVVDATPPVASVAAPSVAAPSSSSSSSSSSLSSSSSAAKKSASVAAPVRLLLAYVFRFLDLVLIVLTYIRDRSLQSPPNKFLQANFRPVEKETFQKNLEVVAKDLSILDDMEGEFVRNGPNPKYISRLGYHWFDGDGMLHGVRIKDRKINYVNRWVRTQRFVEEQSAGRAVHARLGGFSGYLGIVGAILDQVKTAVGVSGTSPSKGSGTANTALAFHDGRLLALVESDHPYAVRLLLDGQLETLGRHSYEGKLKHPFTAHPKVDPDTNELLFFGYSLMKKPYCSYSVVNEQGKLIHNVPIDIPKPVMMHDFVITKNYSLFLDFPLEFDPKNMAKGSVFQFNSNRPSRFGVLGRHETKEKLRWFNFQPGYVFHNFNAWEHVNEKGETQINIIGCRSKYLDLDLNNTANLGYPKPHLYQINLSTGETYEAGVSEVECEFPSIHPNKVGRPNQYTFCATFAPNRHTLFDSIVKFDLSGYRDGSIKEIGRIFFGEGCFGGESVFVPRKNSEKEDDGFLMTFVYNEKVDQSDFVVYDAKNMAAEPLVRVRLPQRVPYGFHGLFVEEEKLQHQKDYLP